MTVSTTASKYLLKEVVPEYDKPTNIPSEPCAEYSHGVLAVHPRFWLGRAPRLVLGLFCLSVGITGAMVEG